MTRLLRSGAAACFLLGCTLQKDGIGESVGLGLDGEAEQDTALIDPDALDSDAPDPDAPDPDGPESDAESGAPDADAGVDASLTDAADGSLDGALDAPDARDARADVSDTRPGDSDAETGVDPITCTKVDVGTTFDLTALGSKSWAHYGLGTGYNHKLGEASISAITTVGTLKSYAAYAVSFSWSDGTPQMTASMTKAGAFVNGAGSSLAIDVAGDGAVHTLRLYVAVSNGVVATLQAVVSGMTLAGSLPPSPKTGDLFAACDIPFATSTSMKVTLKQTSAAGAINLLAAKME